MARVTIEIDDEDVGSLAVFFVDKLQYCPDDVFGLEKVGKYNYRNKCTETITRGKCYACMRGAITEESEDA